MAVYGQKPSPIFKTENMAWHFYLVDDECGATFAACSSVDEWLGAIQRLSDEDGLEVVDGFYNTWPLWLAATKYLKGTISLLLKGELHTDREMNIGFNSAIAVRELAKLLQMPDAWFLNMLIAKKTEWDSQYWDDVSAPERLASCTSELLFLQQLRAFYADAAKREKAVVMILMD